MQNAAMSQRPSHRRRCMVLALWALVAAVCSAASADFPVPPKWSAVLTRSGAIEAKHGHIQGICAAQDAVYMTLVNGLYKFDWQGRLVKRINLNPHVGDICLWKDRLYLVTCGGGKGTIEVFDCNLSHIKGAPTVRSADGITCCPPFFIMTRTITTTSLTRTPPIIKTSLTEHL